jgi:hypothetical protein
MNLRDYLPYILSLHASALKLAPVVFSEVSVSTYKFARCHNKEDHNPDILVILFIMVHPEGNFKKIYF